MTTRPGATYRRDGRTREVLAVSPPCALWAGAVLWRGWTRGGESFEELASWAVWERWMRGAVEVEVSDE